MEEDKLVNAEFNDTEHHFIKLKEPSPYTLQIGDEGAVYQITAFQVLKGTLSRFRWLGLLPMRLEALHEVTIYSPKNAGKVEVLAKDTPAMRISGLTRSHAPVAGGADSAIYSWSETFSNDDTPSIHLPAGQYDFVLTVEGCTKPLRDQIVPLKSGEQIDFQRACATP
jgi:hypothetical protein